MQSGEIVKRIVREEGITISELSRRLGISRQAMYKRLGGDMRSESLIECIEALGYGLYYGKDGRVKRLRSRDEI